MCQSEIKVTSKMSKMFNFLFFLFFAQVAIKIELVSKELVNLSPGSNLGGHFWGGLMGSTVS